MLKGTVKPREIKYGSGFKVTPDTEYPAETAMRFYRYLRDGREMTDIPDFHDASRGEPPPPPPPPKTPCDRLSKDKVFTDWAKGLWNVARSSTPWLETGGLFGHRETTLGTSVTATYDRLTLPTSLPYWNGWMGDTLADTKESIHWEYMVHTHPVSGSTEISGITGDRSEIALWELPSIAIGKEGAFSVWGIDGKRVCNGSLETVR